MILPFCQQKTTLACAYLVCQVAAPFLPPALHIHGPTKSWDLLVNLLLALARLSIYPTKNSPSIWPECTSIRLAQGKPEQVWDCLALLHSCLWVEVHWSTYTSSLNSFREQWALAGVLCLVSPSSILVIYLWLHSFSCFLFICPPYLDDVAPAVSLIKGGIYIAFLDGPKPTVQSTHQILLSYTVTESGYWVRGWTGPVQNFPLPAPHPLLLPETRNLGSSDPEVVPQSTIFNSYPISL